MAVARFLIGSELSNIGAVSKRQVLPSERKNFCVAASNHQSVPLWDAL